MHVQCCAVRGIQCSIVVCCVLSLLGRRTVHLNAYVCECFRQDKVSRNVIDHPSIVPFYFILLHPCLRVCTHASCIFSIFVATLRPVHTCVHQLPDSIFVYHAECLSLSLILLKHMGICMYVRMLILYVRSV